MWLHQDLSCSCCSCFNFFPSALTAQSHFTSGFLSSWWKVHCPYWALHLLRKTKEAWWNPMCFVLFLMESQMLEFCWIKSSIGIAITDNSARPCEAVFDLWQWTGPWASPVDEGLDGFFMLLIGAKVWRFLIKSNKATTWATSGVANSVQHQIHTNGHCVRAQFVI